MVVDIIVLFYHIYREYFMMAYNILCFYGNFWFMFLKFFLVKLIFGKVFLGWFLLFVECTIVQMDEPILFKMYVDIVLLYLRVKN